MVTKAEVKAAATPAALSGAEKVAVLLLALGKARAAKLLKRFDPEDLKLLTRSASDLQSMVSLADQHMVPWMEWEYCWCNEGGPGQHNPQGMIYDENNPPAGENLNSAVYEALVEPYPQLVAGTPRSWGFDRASRTFTFSYATEAAGGTAPFRPGSVTRVSTPRFSYLHGFGVQVGGGRLVSKPGALLTRIASCPGASEVAVTIAAAIAPSQGC